MSPLVTFTLFLGVGILTAYMVVWKIRLHRRDLDQAIEYVVKTLNSPRNDKVSEIILGHASPLSDHMVKDIADSRGFRFIREASRHSNTVLEFTRLDEKHRKLSLDD